MSTQDDALPEPVAFMWMHDETGRIGFVDVWQLKNGWQQANPRCKVKRPLFAADQMHAAIARERELQQNNADNLRQQLADLKQSAQAVINRWDTPLWKDTRHTGEYINALRAAIAAGAQK